MAKAILGVAAVAAVLCAVVSCGGGGSSSSGGGVGSPCQSNSCDFGLVCCGPLGGVCETAATCTGNGGGSGGGSGGSSGGGSGGGHAGGSAGAGGGSAGGGSAGGVGGGSGGGAPTCIPSGDVCGNANACCSGLVCVGGACTNAQTSTLTWNITDECDDGVVIQYEFFDTNNGLEWPGNGNAYDAVQGQAYSNPLSCTTGDTICYGADQTSPGADSGLGIDGTSPCPAGAVCCYICTTATATTPPLTCP